MNGKIGCGINLQGKPFSFKEETDSALWGMDGGHSDECEKPDWEGQILHDTTLMKNLK